MKTVTVQTRGEKRDNYGFYLKMPKEHFFNVVFNLREKNTSELFEKFNLIPHLHSDLSKFNVREKLYLSMVTKLLPKARNYLLNAKLFTSFINKQKIV